MTDCVITLCTYINYLLVQRTRTYTRRSGENSYFYFGSSLETTVPHAILYSHTARKTDEIITRALTTPIVCVITIDRAGLRFSRSL